jgi:zinc protease
MTLLSVVLAAVSFAADPVPDAPQTHATVTTLPNGLTVILEPQDRTGQVALDIKYRVGSRDERDGEHGCAHLFEHLMFEGSKGVPTNAFDVWLTAAGGENNAYTSEDETVYTMTFPSNALDLALFLESDRMAFLDAGLDQANVNNQQSVVLQERATGYAEPRGREDDALSRLMWPSTHPYHVPVIGTVADVSGFQIDRVRDFWSRHYLPRNATLVMVGNFDPAVALERVTHWFSDVPDRGEAATRVTEAVPPDVAAHGKLEDDVEDRTMHLVWPTVPRGNADEAALDLLSWVLDGGRGTRIDDAIYYTHPLANDWMVGHWTRDLVGEFQVTVTSDSVPLTTLSKVVLREIDKVARKAPTDDEVERARRTAWSYMEDALEAPANRAAILLACWDRYQDPNCMPREKARYDGVTAEDVRRVAATYLVPARMTTLSVVPNGDDGALPGATPVELP